MLQQISLLFCSQFNYPHASVTQKNPKPPVVICQLFFLCLLFMVEEFYTRMSRNPLQYSLGFYSWQNQTLNNQIVSQPDFASHSSQKHPLFMQFVLNWALVLSFYITYQSFLSTKALLSCEVTIFPVFLHYLQLHGGVERAEWADSSVENHNFTILIGCDDSIV